MQDIRQDLDKGYTQQHGFDLMKHPPVFKPTTIRVVLTIALHRSCKIKQLDVNNAFLNENLKGEVYMKQPQGYKLDRRMVCKFNKTIYGVKPAPRVWFDKLKFTLTNLKLQLTISDNSLFTRINNV